MVESYPTDYLVNLRQRYEDRVHDWMIRNLSCDIPTARFICREYYEKDLYLDVTFLGPEAWKWDNILARFVHDPMKKPHDQEWPRVWGDEIVIRQDERLGSRRLSLSPGFCKALERVLFEPD